MPLERRNTDVSSAEIIDRVLDKGLVIDYYGHVSALGVDLWTTIEARVIVASIETYLQYSSAIGRTGLLAERALPYMLTRV
jgi:gas vesicle structural protein